MLRPPRALEEAVEDITDDVLKEYLATIASDAFEGRNTGFPGQEKAADYLESKLMSFGVAPAGDTDPNDPEHRQYRQAHKVKELPTHNVVGVIPGSSDELRNQIILIGAHYDHLGRLPDEHAGRRGKASATDEIWNGADDNGSGTTAVLALASLFGSGGVSCARTLVFAFFSGEEWGLFGSRWYVEHPYETLDAHRFMLNLDMIGRNPRLNVRLETSGPITRLIRPVAQSRAKALGLKLVVLDQGEHVAPNSDHFVFYRKKIPQAFFFTGLHADYHRISDHAEKISYSRMVSIIDVAAHVIDNVCRAETIPSERTSAQ